jgi:hypothetical protein
VRNIYDRYDLPRDERDDRQMCGRLALLLGAAAATIALWAIVEFFVRLFTTALVVVQ